jgi:hypothetical protein
MGLNWGPAWWSCCIGDPRSEAPVRRPRGRRQYTWVFAGSFPAVRIGRGAIVGVGSLIFTRVVSSRYAGPAIIISGVLRFFWKIWVCAIDCAEIGSPLLNKILDVRLRN